MNNVDSAGMVRAGIHHRDRSPPVGILILVLAGDPIGRVRMRVDHRAADNPTTRPSSPRSGCVGDRSRAVQA